MPRIPRDPNATPEQNAARVLQNAGATFATHAERFAGLCERYAEDMTPEDRDLLESWVRRWGARLTTATQPGRPDGMALRLIGDDNQPAPMAPADPDATPASL